MRRPRLDASDLTAALVLESQARVPDGGGGWTTTWAPLGTLWGELRPVSGSEREHGGRSYGRVTHRVTVRAAPAGSPRRPRADQRFLAGPRVLNIVGVAEAKAPGFLTCWCEEGPLS